MLYTNLNHIESAEEFVRIISENENVAVICGRMGPLCIPVYRIAEELETEYSHIRFYDMEYDNPELYFFHELPAVKDLPNHPFTVYFKNGEAVKAMGGIQSKAQMRAMLDENLTLSIPV